MQRFVEIRILLAILTLAEELNFTRAAKRLGVSQSALSRQVASFERKQNLKLFERNHAGVSLTDCGRAFVAEAQVTLLHDERALQAARAASDGVEQVLNVGRSPYADPFLTSVLLSIELPLYPKLKIHLHSDFAPELIHALIVSTLDIALIANPGVNRKLTTAKVSEAPIYVVLPDGSPLLEKTSVILQDLAGQNWILFDRKAHPLVHDSLFRRAAEESIIVRNGQTVLTADDAAHLVRENLGVAFMTMTGALRIARDGAHVRPLIDKELRMEVCLASRADNPSKLVSEFARAFMRRISQVKKPPEVSTRRLLHEKTGFVA